jgi:hypothetical protein
MQYILRGGQIIVDLDSPLLGGLQHRMSPALDRTTRSVRGTTTPHPLQRYRDPHGVCPPCGPRLVAGKSVSGVSSVRKTRTRLLGPCFALASLMALVRSCASVATASSTRVSSIAPIYCRIGARGSCSSTRFSSERIWRRNATMSSLSTPTSRSASAT